MVLVCIEVYPGHHSLGVPPRVGSLPVLNACAPCAGTRSTTCDALRIAQRGIKAPIFVCFSGSDRDSFLQALPATWLPGIGERIGSGLGLQAGYFFTGLGPTCRNHLLTVQVSTGLGTFFSQASLLQRMNPCFSHGADDTARLSVKSMALSNHTLNLQQCP